MNKDELVTELKVNSHLRTPEQIRAFDQALEGLTEISDLRSEHLRDLLMVFEDDCEDEEVMFGLVHLVEHFDLKEFLEDFIEVVPQLYAKAPNWTKVFLYRILNSDKARSMFMKKLPASESTSKSVIRKLLEEIADTENPPLSTHAGLVLNN